MTEYLTEDPWGHCKSQKQINELKAAIDILNKSNVIAMQEEDANHHREADFRKEMADSLHIADIDEWQPYEYDLEHTKVATCKVCGAELMEEHYE